MSTINLLKSISYKNKVFSGIILLGFFLVFLSQPAEAEEYCTKKNTTSKLSLTEATSLAQNSQICSKVGRLKDNHWCNEITGTWWIPISTKMQGCSPTCVVNVVNKSVNVNYMCTGLLRAEQKDGKKPKILGSIRP